MRSPDSFERRQGHVSRLIGKPLELEPDAPRVRLELRRPALADPIDADVDGIAPADDVTGVPASDRPFALRPDAVELLVIRTELGHPGVGHRDEIAGVAGLVL